MRRSSLYTLCFLRLLSLSHIFVFKRSIGRASMWARADLGIHSPLDLFLYGFFEHFWRYWIGAVALLRAKRARLTAAGICVTRPGASITGLSGSSLDSLWEWICMGMGIAASQAAQAREYHSGACM